MIPCATVLMLLVATAVSADWPTFRRDHARTGHAAGQSLDGVEVLWSSELGGSVDSSPAVVGNTVYVGNSLGAMHAVAASDGAVTWAFQTGGAVVSSPAVADGIVVFGSADGFCYALDATTGEQAWCYRTRGPVLSSPAVVDGRVFFGSMDGRIYCVSLEGGELVWCSEAGAGIQGSPAVADSQVLYGDDTGSVRSLDVTDGSVVWERGGTGRVIAAPVVANEVVVFGVMGPSALRPPKVDYLAAYSLETGEQRWALNQSYSVLGAPVVAGARVCFITVEGYVSKTVARAADLTTGELLWERPVGGVVDSAPALIGPSAGFEQDLSDVRLCFGCHDGRLYLLNAQTGAVAGVESLAQKIYSSPAVSDGRIYVGADDGRLYCLGSR
jgi:outer membrane protein assembly factor BamB